eukprot:CAMPEP_0179298176 /NCGR_PEP_ID=MMETSP0797-20121207/45857_1 /TAXON_ID=47934 /ORGANISM="Dinophysis acuminata, Strain DAEP01" /LENGTH=99 /DNA_ID=CAMNT_0021007553 /DNA_START=130 /DNA_END=426 /DNA_ORIENTATION=-
MSFFSVSTTPCTAAVVALQLQAAPGPGRRQAMAPVLTPATPTEVLWRVFCTVCNAVWGLSGCAAFNALMVARWCMRNLCIVIFGGCVVERSNGGQNCAK